MLSVKVKKERIVVETDRYRIEGDIVLPPNGYANPLSNYINRDDQEFLCLENVELVALDGSGRNWTSPVLNLRRRHVRSVVPKNSANRE
ncbi:MAG: hypothetical protein JW976_02555 [Syntrophaceae bacterium]|nr:hypothetical protein [Syntrophaceae bacterium]